MFLQFFLRLFDILEKNDYLRDKNLRLYEKAIFI